MASGWSHCATYMIANPCCYRQITWFNNCAMRFDCVSRYHFNSLQSAVKNTCWHNTSVKIKVDSHGQLVKGKNILSGDKSTCAFAASPWVDFGPNRWLLFILTLLDAFLENNLKTHSRRCIGIHGFRHKCTRLLVAKGSGWMRPEFYRRVCC